MKGLMYGGPGKRSWADVPDPGVQDPRDAVIRIEDVELPGPVRVHVNGTRPDPEEPWLAVVQ